MAVYLLDSVKVATPTTGTGSVTVGAAEPGYLTPAEAGAVDGRVYTWRLDDGDDFEIFVGTYSSTGPTISRDTVLVSKISGTAGTSKINLSGTAKLSAVPVADYVVTPRQIREKLTADRTYYVRPDGSDSNDGLTDSPGGAFRTIQKAIDVVSALDFSIYDVTIQIADGTYAPTSGTHVADVRAWAGSGSLTLLGNTSTPSNVVLSATSANAINVSRAALPGKLILNGLKLQTTTSGIGINAIQPCVIEHSNMEFGACATMHMNAAFSAYISAQTNYTISGGSVRHWSASTMGRIDCIGKTVTLSGTPNFSEAFAMAIFGYVACNGNTFSGSATGRRYLSTNNGVIASSGATLPGNLEGTTSDGGIYK